MFLVAFLFLWQTTFEITKIDIEGLTRLQAPAVLKSLGLAVGSSGGKTEFDAACQSLIRTGLFEGCNWKYMPTTRTGITLTFHLKEAEAGQKVLLKVPGVDDKQLWDWLHENEPLVQPQMPSSDEAVQFYTRAIQRFLKKDVAPSVHTNLETRENTLIFRPANVPAITAVRFTGAQAIDTSTLEKTFAAIAQGTPFTEYDVRQLLDGHIRPIYENLGKLNVRFPSIKAEGGEVTVQVEEGPVYTLAKADTTGTPPNVKPDLPIGQTAHWNTIVNGLEAVAKELRNRGYLDARYKVERQFNHEAGAVSITAAYTPGQEYTFHALRLEGLSMPQETNVRALWKLPVGAPMNEGYVDEFLRAAFQKLGPEFNATAHQLEPAGPTGVDVLVRFQRK